MHNLKQEYKAEPFDFGEYLLGSLSEIYGVKKNDIGKDARMAKKGLTFETSSYEVAGLGHFCVVRMSAMLGLMRMETAILSPFDKDVPLLNIDWVHTPIKETQLAELYDVQLSPYPKEHLAGFERIKENDSDLPDYASGSAHWYDSILYPCSYSKTGKHIQTRAFRAVKAYIETFISQIEFVPNCDEVLKKKKIHEFAETLFLQGGPAVNQVKKLFGEETAKRLILNHMYGVWG